MFGGEKMKMLLFMVLFWIIFLAVVLLGSLSKWGI